MTERAVEGEGWDHVAYRVERADGPWIVKTVKDGDDAVSVHREVAVMHLVAERLPGRAAPGAAVVDDRSLTYPLVPGVALIDLLSTGGIGGDDRRRLAFELGGLIAELATIDPSGIAPALPVEDEGWAPWLAELPAALDVAAKVLRAEDHRAVEQFIGSTFPPPLPVDDLQFTHNDLGGEHVLVDPATLAITGIIDWTDAAVADPAHDVGRLWRDLGTEARPAILDGLGVAGPERSALAERAWCAARLLVVEDLADAIQHRPHLVEFERATLHRLFHP